jgi:hypothetical protein
MALLGGCALRVSSPVVTIRRADLSAQGADLSLRIDNPNRRALTLEGIDYTLTDGAFPIARGSVSWDANIPAGGSADVPLRIPFDPPLASPPAEVELRGELHFRTGPLGFAEVSRSPFAASFPLR